MGSLFNGATLKEKNEFILRWATLKEKNVSHMGSFLNGAPLENKYEGPAKRFVTGFELLQCYVLSNIFLLQTFKVCPLY